VNHIGKQGIIKLSEACNCNSSITSLNLSGNGFVVPYILTQYTGNSDVKSVEQVQKSINRNIQMWRKIHEYIRTNDLKQLMTLLSKHTINLNSLNLSTDGDSILHSAAKSNDVKMMEYVLQRLSRNTKQRMMKMKNEQQQLPSDLLATTVLKRWTPSIHSLFPLKFRLVVKAVLMLGAKRQDGTPYYPQTHFYKLPKDLLFIILQYSIP
jgi:hypothetical protein